MTSTAALRRAHLTRQAANRQIADIVARFVPEEKWGRDHLSTLLYLETRCVDHRGYLDPRSMRGRDPKYPTRLKGGETIDMHSDWDCIDDMIMAGKVERVSDVRDRYRLTPAGWTMAHRLRRERAERGLA